MCGRGEGMRGGSEKCKNQMSKGKMNKKQVLLYKTCFLLGQPNLFICFHGDYA